ncbi:MAG: NADH-quinone oxidoreductase subunit N [Armatimonadetes bacterium]|nr:NADH-quinone oxidoreductase subunit N [Armatimonadota bacterium]
MPENPFLESITALMSPIVLMITGMIVLLIGVGKPSPERARIVTTVAWLGSLGAGMVAAFNLGIGTLLPSVLGESTLSFGGGMINDSLGAVFNIVLAVSAFLSVIMSDRFLAERRLPAGEFFALMLFSASGGMIMAQAFDLVNIFVGLEVLSVALYILSGFTRRDVRSEEAAVKYFLLGAFTSAFLLFGSALVYGAAGITMKAGGTALLAETPSYTNLSTIALALSSSNNAAFPLATNPMFVTGAVLIICGLCFKASIVPFHSYAPDVYEGAPVPVTAFMSAAAKAGAFAAFLRFYLVLLDGGQNAGPYRTLLWGLAAATILVGNILAVRQTTIKRMLAYSSIAHAGYLLVGLLAMAPANGKISGSEVWELAQTSVGYYLLVYTFMNLGAFAVLAWLGRDRGREYTQVSDLAGLAKRQPVAAGVMAVFLLSLAGIPPAAGFFGKLYLFLAAINAGYVGLAALGLLASVIGAVYYLNVIVSMFFRDGENGFSSANARGGAMWAAIIAAVATLLLGLIPLPNITPKLQQKIAPPKNAKPKPSIRPGT